MGNRGSGGFSPKEDTAKKEEGVIVTPEILASSRIVRRIGMISATVPAENGSPLEAAEEMLAEKASARGANVVMGVSALSATAAGDGYVDFGSTDTYNLPSYGKIVLPGANIVVWGLAILYDHNEQ